MARNARIESRRLETLRRAGRALLVCALACLAGCPSDNQQLLDEQEAVREELEMLRARLERLEADMAREARRLPDIEKQLGETGAEDGEGLPAKALVVGRPDPGRDTERTPRETPAGDDADGGASTTADKSAGGSGGTGRGELPVDEFTVLVQRALRNAGYDPGPIDGRAGAATWKAIREFQRDNNLPETEVADVATWDLLRRYQE